MINKCILHIAANIFVQIFFSLILQSSMGLHNHGTVIIIVVFFIIIIIIIARVVIIIVVIIISGRYVWSNSIILVFKLEEEVLPPGVEHGAAPGGCLQGVEQPIVWADAAIGASSSCLVSKVSILFSLTLPSPSVLNKTELSPPPMTWNWNLCLGWLRSEGASFTYRYMGTCWVKFSYVIPQSTFV